MTEPKVFVRDASGRPVEVETQEGKDYVQRSNTPRISEALARRESGERAVDAERDKLAGPAGQAALGVLGGLSLGIAPAIGARLGGNEDMLRSFQRSGYYQAGEVGGALLPAVFGGGPLEAAGAGAESLMARVLPQATGILGKAANGALQMAARGSAEGALMNIGQTTADHILYNRALTAEALAASGTEGALFGGLVGGGLGAAGGLVGGGLGAVAGGLGRVATKESAAGVTRGEGLVARALGATSEDIGKMRAVGEGRIAPSLEKFRNAINEAEPGRGFNVPVSRVNEIAADAVKAADSTMQDVIGVLNKEAPGHVPNLGRLAGRLDAEVYQPSLMSPYANEVRSSLDGFMDRIGNAVSAPEGKVWSAFHDARNELAKFAPKSGPASEVYAKALNALDSEIALSMQEAAAATGRKGLAESYAAAKTNRLFMEHLEEMTGNAVNKAAADATGLLNPLDLGQAAGAVAFGHPLGAVAVLAGKYASRMAEGALQPALAELAFKMSAGAVAGEATAFLQQKIQGAVKGFFEGTKGAAMLANAKAYNFPKDRDEFDRRLDRAQELMSPQYNQHVRSYAAALEKAGYADLAARTMELNGRAIQYLRHNAPASKKAEMERSLGPVVKKKDVSVKDMQFLQKHGVITAPHAALDRIGNGLVDKVTMDGLKAGWPETHASLVYEAQRYVVNMKAQGKFLPADKIVGLGLMLGAAVDPMLEKSYIDAVQASHVPPQKPEAAPPQEPTVNVDDYRTPLERSLA